MYKFYNYITCAWDAGNFIALNPRAALGMQSGLNLLQYIYTTTAQHMNKQEYSASR